MDYSKVALRGSDLIDGTYKRHLGGGRDEWDRRGAFQLHFLQSKGLKPSSTCLDIGCGPLRGGVHIAAYLEPGNYFGYDENPSFIRAARHVVASAGLTTKGPGLAVDRSFAGPEERTFDYGLAFSVLNHCDSAARRTFFANAPASFHSRSRIFITHARWFDPQMLDGSLFSLADRIESGDLSAFGWSKKAGVFPIVELRCSTAPPPA